MKKWKIIEIVTIIILVVFVMYLVFDAVTCTQMDYPHPMLGIEAYTWIDQFSVDLYFILIIFGLPIMIDIILLIVSIIKLKKCKNK